MKKLVLSILLITITLTLTGCSLFERTHCEEDGVLIPFEGDESREFEGMNIGVLNQCNDEVNTIEEYDQIMAEMDANLSGLIYVWEDDFNSLTDYDTILDERPIAKSDLNSINYFDVERSRFSLDVRLPFVSVLDLYDVTNDIEPFELSMDGFYDTYTGLTYVNENFMYQFSQATDDDAIKRVNQNRMYVSDESTIVETFSYRLGSEVVPFEQIQYTLHDIGEKYISFHYGVSSSEENKTMYYIKTTYDFHTQTLEVVHYLYVYDFSRIQYYRSSVEDQQRTLFSIHKANGEEPDYFLKYDHFENNDYVISIDKKLGTENNQEYITFNMNYVSGWSFINQISENGSIGIFDDNMAEISVFNPETQATLSQDFNLSSMSDIIPIFDYQYELDLHLDSFTEEYFNNPSDGLTFSGAITYDELMNRYDETAGSLMDMFAISDTEVILYGETYSNKRIQIIYNEMIPSEFVDFFEQLTVNDKSTTVE